MLFYVDEKNIFEHSSSSEGMQLKWFKDNYYIKQDSLGYEALSEVICSILSSHISNLDYVNYDFCKVSYKDVIYTNCCYSKNFLLDGEVAKTLPRLFSNRGVNLLEFINNLPKIDVPIEYSRYLDRVKRLLDIRLRELEGKAWISI